MAASSLLLVLLAASLVVPALAHATYADVADTYGTVEEIAPKSDTIYAEDIPDGTYRDVTVRTSSSFCKVTNCTLKKDGGTLVAAFTLTTTYTAIYVGTAEEAAASTDAAGDDDSAYTLAKEVDIGGKTLHQFTIALPAVSESLYIATFNGGSRGHEKACWYDRSFIFDASDSIIMAVQSGSAPDEDGGSSADSGKDDSSDKDSGKDDEKSDGGKSDKGNKAAKDDGEKKSPASTEKTSDSEKKPATSKKDESKADKKDKDEDSKDKKPAAAASSTSPKGSGGSGNGSGSSSSSDSSDKEDASAEASDGSGSSDRSGTGRATIPGVPLSFVSADLVPDELDAAAAEKEKDTSNTWGIDPMILLALTIFCALVLVGIALHVLWFKRAGGTLGRI